MNVNFEFLDEEPIENIITCLNYRFDKVVFFGYMENINKSKASLTNFLQNVCDVKEVEFWPLSEKKLDKTLATMEKFIDIEEAQGNKIFFDITGGEDVILVAFGMLCERNNYPLHLYKVEDNQMIDMSEFCEYSIESEVPTQSIKLSVRDLISLRGGIVNNALSKSEKADSSEEYIRDVESVWNISRNYEKIWTTYSCILGKAFNQKSLVINTDIDTVNADLAGTTFRYPSVEELNGFLDKLADAGLLVQYNRNGKNYSFRYKSDKIKQLLTMSGDVLEIHTGAVLSSSVDDYIVGANLDWDGVIHRSEEAKVDVYNEIDVLTIKDNYLTFISCKDGQLEGTETDEELYKLDTVAKKFGGKYYRTILIAPLGIPKSKEKRAKELGVEIYKDIKEGES